MAALKYSRQRESIKNYLCSSEEHPTADMIYADIRREFPNISLGTVYRNLSLLIDLGEVRRIKTEHADRFDANLTPHRHFICRKCGRVMDVKIPVENPVKTVNELWPFGIIDECRMEFYGTCNQCQKR